MKLDPDRERAQTIQHKTTGLVVSQLSSSADDSLSQKSLEDPTSATILLVAEMATARSNSLLMGTHYDISEVDDHSTQPQPFLLEGS